MKAKFLAALTIAALSLSTSQAAIYNLSGLMDVLQAGTNGGFGAGTGIGTGTISGTFDDVSKLLDYQLTWQDLSGPATNMHFHLGAPGVSGGVQLPIPSPFTSPKIVSGVALSATQESNLLAGNWYVNVHTSAFTGGEIRGQVNVSQIPEPATAGLAAAACFGIAALVRRRRAG
ncbi:MAG: CHRD domain-containing protein [Planctomycetales bacterium]|nr:CHRD domain-containing protein [Planctomycetales bacterium]